MSLIVRGLQKSFSQGGQPIEVLRGVDFDIPTGKCAALLGSSGSGKSTLLSLLAGLDSADKGQIQILDHQKQSRDVTHFDEATWTRFRGENIGIVFQQYHLIPHLTALENVQLPMEILGRKDPEKKAKEMLEEVGLSQRLTHWPSQLSGGESQRVAIARALVMEPKLLLADEPSGSLDVETGESVMGFFFRMVEKHQMTTLLVTHNPELAQKCDFQILLKAGRVTEVITK